MRNFQSIYENARSNKLVDERDDSLIFYDLDLLKQTLQNLKDYFPENFQHTVAVKTNSLEGVLGFIGKQGMGHEAASAGEVRKAAENSDGFIVYDGPAKTHWELEELLSYRDRLLVNANSYHDLQKVLAHPFQNIGLRINMQVSTDVHAIFDVSHKNSKFGLPISDREGILRAFTDNSKLNGIHFHLGSGITELGPYRKALRMIRELLSDIHGDRRKKGIQNRIEFLDMGGGLLAEKEAGQFDRLRSLGQLIKEEFSDLSDQYTIITEFGQYIHTHNSWLYSRIADLLTHTDPETLILYQGANMFVRQAYTDQKPPFQYYVMGKEGSPRNKDYNLAGPLCFSGDYIAKRVSLPPVSMDDSIIIDGIGANTYSLWSEHCSFGFPKVVWVEGERNLERLEIDTTQF